ncbi:MAG TPA: hypothetical protein VD999_06525 [Vitreimonas sp.]|nr:hypothetical protein [Vitreimonas sp.]
MATKKLENKFVKIIFSLWGIYLALGLFITLFYLGGNWYVFGEPLADNWLIFQQKRVPIHSFAGPFNPDPQYLFNDVDGDGKQDLISNGCAVFTKAPVAEIKDSNKCHFSSQDAEYIFGELKLSSEQVTDYSSLVGQKYPFEYESFVSIYDKGNGQKALYIQKASRAESWHISENSLLIPEEPSKEMKWIALNNTWMWPDWLLLVVMYLQLPYIYLGLLFKVL